MAYQFGSTGQAYITSTQSVMFDWTQPYTIGFWYRWDTTGSYNTLVGLHGTSDSTVYDWMGHNDSTAGIAIDSGGGSSAEWQPTTGASTAAVGTWCYLCLRRNSTTSLAALVNGVQGGSVSSANTSGKPALTRLQFGSYTASQVNPAYASLFNAMVWTRALTDGEILAQMYSLYPLHWGGMFAWWPMWPGQAMRNLDHSGNGNHLLELATVTEAEPPSVVYADPGWGFLPVAVAGGTTYNITPSGSLTPAGALVKTPTKVLAGALTPAGAIIFSTTKLFAGAVTPTGALAKTTTKPMTGSVTPTGALATFKTTLVTLAGALAPAGDLIRTTTKALTGALTPAGDLARTTTKIFAGSVTPEGALTTIRSFFVQLAGSLTPTGALVRTTTKALAGALTPAGDLLKTTTKILAGSLTPAGALVAIRTFFVDLAGSLTPTGALVRTTTKVLAGTVTPTGNLMRTVTKVLAGSLAPTGALQVLRTAYLFLTGSVTPAGALIKTTTKALVGSVTPTGAVARTVTKILAGAVSFAGSLSTSGGAAAGLVVEKFKGMYRGMFKKMR